MELLVALLALPTALVALVKLAAWVRRIAPEVQLPRIRLEFPPPRGPLPFPPMTASLPSSGSVEVPAAPHRAPATLHTPTAREDARGPANPQHATISLPHDYRVVPAVDRLEALSGALTASPVRSPAAAPMRFPAMTTTGNERGTSPTTSTGASLTLREAADRCGVTLKSVRRRVERKTLTARRVERDGQLVMVVELAELERVGLLPRTDSPGRGRGTPSGHDPADGTPARGIPGTPRGTGGQARLAVLSTRLAERTLERDRLRGELEDERGERLQLAHALGQARERLALLPESTETSSTVVDEQRRWGRGAATLAGGIAIVCLVAGAAWSWRQTKDAQAASASARSMAASAQAAQERAQHELEQADAFRVEGLAALGEARSERERAELGRALFGVELAVLEVVGEMLR